MNYIIPPHMWVRETARNVGLPHLAFSSPVGPPPSSLCNRSFQLPESFQHWELTFLSTVTFRATKILSTLKVDIPVDFRGT